MNPKPIVISQTVCRRTNNTHRNLAPMIPKVVMAIAALWGLSGQTRANDPMLIPPTRIGSSNWGASESVNQMFSWATPVIGQPDPGYFIDTGGHAWDSAGEVNLIAWMVFGEDKVFTALDFATQSNNDGFNRVKLWISNDLATFTVVNGNTPSAGTPDLNVTCGGSVSIRARGEHQYLSPAGVGTADGRNHSCAVYHPHPDQHRIHQPHHLRFHVGGRRQPHLLHRILHRSISTIGVKYYKCHYCRRNTHRDPEIARQTQSVLPGECDSVTGLTVAHGSSGSKCQRP